MDFAVCQRLAVAVAYDDLFTKYIIWLSQRSHPPIVDNAGWEACATIGKTQGSVEAKV